MFNNSRLLQTPARSKAPQSGPSLQGATCGRDIALNAVVASALRSRSRSRAQGTIYSPQASKETVLDPQKFWHDDGDAGVGRGRECGVKVTLVVASYPSKCLGANNVVLTGTSCVGVYLHTSVGGHRSQRSPSGVVTQEPSILLF